MNFLKFMNIFLNLSVSCFVPGQSENIFFWKDTEGNIVDNGNKQIKPSKWRRSVEEWLRSPLFQGLEELISRNNKNKFLIQSTYVYDDDLLDSNLKKIDKNFDQEFFLWQDEEGNPLKFGLKQIEDSDNLLYSDLLRPFFHRTKLVNKTNKVIQLINDDKEFNRKNIVDNIVRENLRRRRLINKGDKIEKKKKKFLRNSYLKNMKQYEENVNKLKKKDQLHYLNVTTENILVSDEMLSSKGKINKDFKYTTQFRNIEKNKEDSMNNESEVKTTKMIKGLENNESCQSKVKNIYLTPIPKVISKQPLVETKIPFNKILYEKLKNTKNIVLDGLKFKEKKDKNKSKKKHKGKENLTKITTTSAAKTSMKSEKKIST